MDSRYGDGREIFIPRMMLKVLPGDKVAICIRPAKPVKGKQDKPGRTVAEIERLIEAGLDEFVGHIVQGQGHFVVPDLAGLSRWLFIPPHARNGVAPGDLVSCALLRHPIKDGKPSAKILKRLGDETTPGVENGYCAARAGLPEQWSEKSAQPLVDAAAQCQPLEDATRLDLTALPFVSIDAARTVDIDDALHAEVTTSGWNRRSRWQTRPPTSRAWRARSPSRRAGHLGVLPWRRDPDAPRGRQPGIVCAARTRRGPRRCARCRSLNQGR